MPDDKMGTSASVFHDESESESDIASRATGVMVLRIGANRNRFQGGPGPLFVTCGVEPKGLKKIYILTYDTDFLTWITLL